MACARRVTLFEREIRERLSRVAVEILLDEADVLSEGQLAGEGSERRYFGSTMITIDLAVLTEVVREPCDASSARRTAILLQREPRALARVRAVAEQEARRLARAPLRRVASELVFRWEGLRVFVDVDVEGA
jgi:hypothetical protein